MNSTIGNGLVKTSFAVVLILRWAFPSPTVAQSRLPLSLHCRDARVVRADFTVTEDANPGTLTTSPIDAKGAHVPGLRDVDFVVSRGKKFGEILSVTELTAVENTVMRIVVMVDNSQSMSPYLRMLRETLADLVGRFSPAVRVSMIFFNEQQLKNPPYEYNGKPLPLVRYPFTNEKARIVEYSTRMLTERLLTKRTYLYDGVWGVLQQIAADTGMVDKSFAIVFSDGADNASTVDPQTVLRSDRRNTVFFTIDYLTEENDFLVRLAERSGGRHFQAKKAEELRGIFEEIAQKIVARGYAVRYRFKAPPTVSIALSTDSLIMEEEIVRETFPLLNYVFFEQGSGVIPPRYVLLNAEKARTFDEQAVEGDAMEYYRNVLNIIGSRLRKRENAHVRIAGYVNDFGYEKKNAILASDRANAVRSYLMTVWGIEGERLETVTGLLPPIPSTNREEEGRAENSRVEITSDDWEILKPVTFIRRQATFVPETVTIFPALNAEEGLSRWMLKVRQEDDVFDERTGNELEKRILWNWKNRRGEIPKSTGVIRISLVVEDSAGDTAAAEAPPVIVRELKREQRRNVIFEDGVTREKISLILFPFDVFTPGPLNETIMDEFVTPRLKSGCTVRIVGHTDAIGTSEYNLILSRNRAEQVRAYLQKRSAGIVASSDITADGVGEDTPIFPNTLPENRFYNRTVEIIIEAAAR
ncbi:MAG: OmpA family protein [Bacteroidota bacterium]|nr:OmpA family protein [Bacteroidota bacterium]